MRRVILHVVVAFSLLTLLPANGQAQQDRITYVPSLDYKSFLIKKTVKTAEKRDRVIGILHELLKLYPPGVEKAQLRVRLAQLYLDKARHLYFLELYKNDPDAEKILEGTNALEKRSATKNLELKNSFAYNIQAIKIFRDVLRKYPKIENRDEVMFYLAYNLGEIGKNNEALSLYRELIRRYPNSDYVPEAYLVQGEYYFFSNNLKQAISYYKKLRKYPNNPVSDLAEYKLAWCYFNLNSKALAMKTLEKLILVRSSEQSVLDLREEAIRDLVVMFSFGGYYKEAPFYFKQVGGEEHYRPMLKQLANLYYKQGKNSYAQVMYKRAIKEDPSDKDNPEMQKRLVEIAKRLGQKEDVLIETSRLVRFYSDESKWSQKNRNDWNALQQARELSEKTLRNVALSLHNEAQKTKVDRTYKLAMVAYREYLDNFPRTKIAPRIRFYYAESLYKLEQMEQAAIQYTKVLTDNPKGKFALQAAYGAIVSYDELTKDYSPKIPKGSTTPVFVPLWQREIVRVADNFVQYFPRDKRSPQIAFKAAKVFYDHNHFKEAVKRFDRLIAQYPKSGAARFSVNLVLDSWNLQERWAQVVKWGKRYYNNPNLPGGRFKQNLYTIVEKASFKVGKSLEESGQHTEAAKAYLAFADEFKKSNFVDDALNNAGVNYSKGRDTQKSIAVFRRLVKEYPRSKYVRSAMLSIGRGYEDLGLFQSAAYYYEQFQKRYPSSSDSADLIYNAGLFRENLGQLDKAVVDYRIYVSRYPKSKDIAQTEFTIAELLERQGQYDAAAKTYRMLENKYRRNASLYLTAIGKRGLIYRKKKDTARAQAVFRRIIKEYRALSRRKIGREAIDLVAESHVHLVEASLRSFRRIRLDKGLDVFERNIRKKTQRLDYLINQYQSIVNYGSGPWSTAAIYKLGVAYDDFARKLKQVEAPAGLDPAMLESFNQQINQFIQNMQEKAIASYTSCLERAALLGVFHPSVSAAEKRRADLTAEFKTKVDEAIHKPVYVDDIVGGAKLL